MSDLDKLKKAILEIQGDEAVADGKWYKSSGQDKFLEVGKNLLNYFGVDLVIATLEELYWAAAGQYGA